MLLGLCCRSNCAKWLYSCEVRRLSYACSAIKNVSIKNERHRYIGNFGTVKSYRYIPGYASPRLGYITETHGRFFSTNKSGNDDGPGEDEVTQPIPGPVRERSDDEYPTHHSLPVTVAVPEVWPHLPLIAINRNPVFPRFIKLIEVSETLRNDFIDFLKFLKKLLLTAVFIYFSDYKSNIN